VELDRVWGDPSLAVLEIEERNPGDDGIAAKARRVAGLRHLGAPSWRGPRRASGRRRFGDHVPGATLKDQVEVGIRLRAVEGDRRPHPVDVSFERQARGGQSGWPRATNEVRDRGVAERKKAWPILKRFHRPAFDPASQRS
jgi:hypothetical protein